MPRRNSHGKVQYRYYNYRVENGRLMRCISLHPILEDGLKYISKHERRSVNWVIETALADYLGVTVEIKKSKTKPKPAKIVTYDRTDEIYVNNKKKS